MSGRTVSAGLLTMAVALSAKPASAEPARPWSMAAALQLAPLETYPRFALGLEGSHALSRDFRLGAELSFYLPRHDGDVTRSAFAVNGLVQYSLVHRARFRWYVLAGLGVALFRDRYDARSVYSNETVLGPGVTLGTGVELQVGERVGVFLEPRATTYRTGSAVDDEWLEAKLGVRWYGL